MPKFFGTFMQKQAFKNHYVEISAADYNQAYKTMNDHFHDKFATVYDHEKFAGQAEKFGLKCLAKILVIDHGRPEDEGAHVEYRMGAW